MQQTKEKQYWTNWKRRKQNSYDRQRQIQQEREKLLPAGVQESLKSLFLRLQREDGKNAD